MTSSLAAGDVNIFVVSSWLQSTGRVEIQSPRHKNENVWLDLLPDAGRAVCTLAFAALLLTLGAGCAPELSRSFGNIESSRDNASNRSPLDTMPEQPSEWEAVRKASEPYWSREMGSRGNEPSNNERPGGEGSEAGTGKESAAETSASGPDDLLAVVDHDNELPPEYEPEDLAFLHPLDIPTLGGGSMKLREQAAEASSRLIEDARKDGIELLVSSAYRSYDAQVVSYGRLNAIYGEKAKHFSAPPGHSEHQLGTAMDVSNSATDYRLIQRFGQTKAFEWLDRNAASYGFVLSYPREAEEHTGYSWEPWHYRYIGERNAVRYKQSDYASPQRFFLDKGLDKSLDKGVSPN